MESNRLPKPENLSAITARAAHQQYDLPSLAPSFAPVILSPSDQDARRISAYSPSNQWTKDSLFYIEAIHSRDNKVRNCAAYPISTVLLARNETPQLARRWMRVGLRISHIDPSLQSSPSVRPTLNLLL
jgi:hypothetical protein